MGEGLPPGEYFLWAYTLIEILAHEDLVKMHALPEVDDLLSLRPIQVSAGRETEGLPSLPTCKGGGNCPLGRSAVLDLSLDGWRIETFAQATRHSLEVRWHQDEEAVLRFGSHEVCAGEPLLSCRDTGCELTR